MIPAPSASAFTWSVEMPAKIGIPTIDLPFTQCKIKVTDTRSRQGEFTLRPGETKSWSSASTLYLVEGWCDTANARNIALSARTCDGEDCRGTVPANRSCAKDLSVSICRKVANAGPVDYAFGFCPK